MTSIYADYNATSPLCAETKAWMLEAMDVWGNPSSSHGIGRKALEFLNRSRESVAALAAVSPSDLVFTSGGSESNTAALLGCYLLDPKGFKLLTTTVEHSSVRDTAYFLKELGAPVEFLPVQSNGELDLNLFEQRLVEFKPTLVSIMTANNETGVIFPLRQIFELCQVHKARLHTDSVQALGKLPAADWNFCDLISISAHKTGGPKGVGALIVRNGTKLAAIHYGGAQEIKRRGGTENTLGIAGFGGACSKGGMESDWAAVRILRDRFENNLSEVLPGVTIQGAGAPRISNTSNIRIEGIASEVLLSALDLEGISISAGSACSSGSISPSHVVLAMGLSKQAAKECLRFSWGLATTETEMLYVLETVVRHVKRIRERRRDTV